MTGSGSNPFRYELMKSRMPDKTRILCSIILSILLSCAIVSYSPLFSHAGEPRPTEPLSELLPSESDLKGWTLDGEPQTAEGNRLFELINGGAEEYVKQGFRRAIIATYRNDEGKRINLDIYEMLSPESARNIYRNKAGEKGQKVCVGDEAAMEDYYMNFRKGSYQVALSGCDSQKETLELLLRMARLVAKRITVSPRRP
jgi:hypothetical protein